MVSILQKSHTIRQNGSCMTGGVSVRRFQRADAPHVVTLFRDTVHQSCRNDYDTNQLEAWAPSEINMGPATERPLHACRRKSRIGGGIWEPSG